MEATSSAVRGGLSQPITDPVTGVFSRALLLPRLDAELARADRSGGNCSLFLFDVDFFKTVNDAYGHLRGDEVLRQLSERALGLMRSFDELFRYGGDEFAMLLPDTERTEAVRLAQTLVEGIKATALPGDPPLHASISLGVATFPEDGRVAEELLAVADRRNYLAKARGRGGAVADDTDTGADRVGSRLWERDSALSAVHDFLTRLEVTRQGALTVTGQPGAGHTRFLAEVERIGRLRGFSTISMPTDGGPPPGFPVGGRVLLLADTDAAPVLPEVIAQLLAGVPQPELFGVVHASTGDATSIGLPFLGAADLSPWSPAAVRIWVRTALRSEPSRALVNWLVGRSGGLPSKVEAELDRLRERGALVPTDDEGWTVTSTVAGARRLPRLPVPMTELIGREEERARIGSMLSASRLVTLVGPGGIGKTRLSLAVAAAAAPEFDDGAVFVALAETAETDVVVAAIAAALGVDAVPGQRLLDSVTEQLADLSLLLVLDNFEQVMSATRVVSELLAAAPGIKALVTSRERLSLYGERVYQVPPLALPDLASLGTDDRGVARALSDYPALALFDQRAQAVDVNFVLTTESLSAVAALCHRLDGLPLAIELAAVRVDTWTPQALLADLTSHLDALGGGPADLPARQQTLRGTIDWSVRLLPPTDQQLFTQLAVFAGGCTVEAAVEVVGAVALDSEARVADMAVRLEALAGKSLLAAEPQPDGGVRYRMLETIRAHAFARLREDDAADTVRRRHADYFGQLAELAAEELTGPDQAGWAGRIEREYLNMRAAFLAAMDRGEVDTAVRFCLGLWRYWSNGNFLDEGRDWCLQVLGAPRPPADAGAVGVLYAAAVLADEQEDHQAAFRFATDLLALAERIGDRPGLARAHNALGSAAVTRGDYALARAHYEQSLAIWRDISRVRGIATALCNLTKVTLYLGDLDTASAHADECLLLERAAGNARNVLLVLECVVEIQLTRGDLTGARESLDESTRLSRELGDDAGEAMALHQLGLAALLEGDRVSALRLLADALTRRHELGDRQDLAVSFDSVADVVVAKDAPLAAELLGAADGLRSRYGLPVPADLEGQRQATLEQVRRTLDERAFTAAWAAGRSAPLDFVVDRVADAAPA